jgi:hypothetical protein
MERDAKADRALNEDAGSVTNEDDAHENGEHGDHDDLIHNPDGVVSNDSIEVEVDDVESRTTNMRTLDSLNMRAGPYYIN